jgi:cytochrome c peroxidase
MSHHLARSLLLPLFAASLAAQGLGVTAPPENPITPAKVVLGKMLFWEEQMSHDKTIACATCHLPEHGGTDPRVGLHPGLDGIFGTADDVNGSPGVVQHDTNGSFLPSAVFGLHVQSTGRLANPAVGAALHSELFWDGRALSTFTDPETSLVAIQYGGGLESQAVAPILSAVEMGKVGRTWSDVRGRLQTVTPMSLASNLTPDISAALQLHPTYPDLFADAFGDPAITAVRIAFAIASYERTLVPDQTPWDSYMAGNTAALTPTQQQGEQLFNGNGRCNLCHFPPAFTDDQFHNLGNRPWQEDPGHMNVTGHLFERGTFKTPTLRNMGLRPRGFHNGSMPALGVNTATDPNSMVNFYFTGGGAYRDNIDSFILDLQALGVTMADMLAIEDFVRVGLTDPRVAAGLAPFDHPTLRSIAVGAGTSFGTGVAGASQPFLAVEAPAFPGNLDYQIGLAGGDGGGLSLLAFALASSQPPTPLGPLPLYLAGPMPWVLVPLQGTPGTTGYGTLSLPIAASVAPINATIYLQMFALDALAPIGVAASSGFAITVH